MNNASVRTAGVYTSGALVRKFPFSTSSPTCPGERLNMLWFTDTNAHVCFLASSRAQFSLGFFFLVDAAAYSRSSYNGSNVHVKFVDWIPGICSALGMLVINSIEKNRLQADNFSYSGTGVAWKARFVLFLGFALLAGGLAGSVVRFEPLMMSGLSVDRSG